MMNTRPDPALLLTRLNDEQSGRGRLKIFFGASAGVGKTYSMLEAAAKLRDQGVDVLVGCAETHGRSETARLLDNLKILPRRQVEYRGTNLAEFDIDAALKIKPQLILVDEMAHSNAPGSRHSKRWQDVQELLEAGIDVYSTLNVQHIESLHDVVSQITGVLVQERVPDSLLETATEIELVDLPPDELIQRLRDGKIYLSERAESALNNFFRKGNLIALRELALRYTAEHVDGEMVRYRQVHQINEPWPASERMLVCVSNSPLSIRLVRATKRMAVALKAKWYVAFVETSTYLSLPESEKARVIQTLRLAEQLGAETLELSGENVSEELVRWAVSNNVTKIVIGKPAQPRWVEMLRGSIVDDIVRRSGLIDVYVITGDADGQIVRPVSSRSFDKPSDYLASTGIVALCTGIAALMTGHFEPSNVIMIYMLGIVIVASQYGRAPAVLASIVSVASFDFFFVPPFFTFAVSDTQYLVTFVVMLVTALVISTLTARIRQQAQSARLREKRTSALYSMSRELSSTLNLDDLIAIGMQHISETFDGKAALYLPDSESGLQLKFPLEHLDAGVASWCYRNKQPAGLGTSTLPAANALYVPLLGAKNVIGVVAVRPALSERFVAPEQLHLLETFCSQIAVALERAQLADQNELARVQVKSEQLRNSLLSSVSHDLRTPLATITGAASSIVEGSSALTVAKCREMADEIYKESERLNRLVGNLLDMTRVQSGNLKVRKEWCPVDEIIGAALSHLDEKLHDRPVRIIIPADLPLVPVDSILIQQVLVNLLENALKYTPAGSELVLRASVVDQIAQIEVADRGSGISPENREKIFEKFFRAESDHSGVGLGLAICSGIIEAHGGKIWVQSRPGGGSVFKFTLPISGDVPDLPELENHE